MLLCLAFPPIWFLLQGWFFPAAARSWCRCKEDSLDVRSSKAPYVLDARKPSKAQHGNLSTCKATEHIAASQWQRRLPRQSAWAQTPQVAEGAPGRASERHAEMWFCRTSSFVDGFSLNVYIDGCPLLSSFCWSVLFASCSCSQYPVVLCFQEESVTTCGGGSRRLRSIY